MEDGTEVTRTCAWSPPGCHPVGCGLRLFVKDGELVKVEGDPDHPITQGRLCPRCLALKEYIYHPDRILYPMKRAREDRGKDKWERISWDEAYAIIKEQTNRIKEEYGSESIVLFVGTGRHAVLTSHMISDVALNTPNLAYTQSGWSCYGPRGTVCSFLMGIPMIELDYAATYPDRYDNPEWELPEYIVLWGKEPLKSNPDGFFGHAIIDMMKRGSKLIMIDPRMTWLGTRAEEVLRVRPGTDTALALAMLNVIITEDLYDHEFVSKWVYGWDDFAERIEQFTPEWAADITWISAEQIRRVARTIATAHPVNFGWGLAFDQNANGVQLSQAFIALIAITGNLDIPGGTQLGEIYWKFPPPMRDYTGFIDEELMAKRIGFGKHPAVCIGMNSADPDSILDTLETDEPYPLRMGFFDSSNLIGPTNSAQPKRWHDAMVDKFEFAVATDTFFNPTIMACADLVLPVSTFAEHDSIVIPNYGATPIFFGATNKALQVGECKPNAQIAIELCQLLRPEVDPGFSTPEELCTLACGPYPGVDDFEDLQHQVLYQPEVHYKKYETGLMRPDGKPGFNTVTGKLELYSTVYESFGDDPLPYYQEPNFSPVSRPEDAEKYPLILTTGARYYTSFHSEHRQIPTLRKLTPDPLVEIHPDTAAEYGIEEGDWVEMSNMFGSCKQRAHLTPTIDRRIINAAHGWWFPEENPEEPSLFGVWKSNVNSLIPLHDNGKMGFGAPYKNVICAIRKVDETEA